MKNTEQKEQTVRDFKNELEERRELLDDVITKMKEDPEMSPEERTKTLEKIEKNRNLLKTISGILDKRKNKQEE